METGNGTTLAYAVGGEERKRLVKAVAEYKESFSEYMGAPTFAYKVEGITIDRNGVLTFDEEPDAEELESITGYLAARGFRTADDAALTEESTAGADAGNEESMTEEEMETGPEPGSSGGTEEGCGGDGQGTEDGMTVSMPRDFFTDTALENLKKIVESKRRLLMKALETDALPIEITEETVSFPWFQNPDGDPVTASAYTHLVSAICRMAREAKRVTATEKETESEKYTFRCFLLRLGFVGAEFKHERAVLMKNLSGHSAFKTMAEAEAFNEKLKAKKAAERVAKAEGTEETQTQEAAAQEEGSGQEWA